MYVKRLQVNKFRNYESGSVELGEGVNVFEGMNAQGKTNLLEALYLLCVGRSMRTVRDRELIRWQCERAAVKAEVVKKYGSDSVEIVIDKTLNKCIMLNGMPLTRLGELMGAVLGVLFSPEEIKTVKESPSERRRFMDIALSQMSKNYFYLLNRYNKILAQRNKLLKSPNAEESALDVWDMQLVDAGAGIIKSRRGFINSLCPYAKQVHAFLTDNKEEFGLSYEGAQGGSMAEIKQSFYEQLKRTRAADLKLGFSHCGPQKDDMKVSANDIDLRTYGSQGQQRTASLTLKLSLLQLMKEHTGESPILLLDDVMSELDSVRRTRLLQLIKSYQTIITCTELPELDGDTSVRRFKVEDGRVYPVVQ